MHDGVDVAAGQPVAHLRAASPLLSLVVSMWLSSKSVLMNRADQNIIKHDHCLCLMNPVSTHIRCLLRFHRAPARLDHLDSSYNARPHHRSASYANLAEQRTLTFCGANSYEMLRSSAGTSTPRGMNTSPLCFAMACDPKRATVARAHVNSLA